MGSRSDSIFAAPIGHWIGLGHYLNLVRAGAVGLWAQTNYQQLTALFRVEERSTAYAIASVANVLITVAAMVVFVAVLHWGSLGLNDCPPAIWAGITEDAMKQRFAALTVLLNGPRHFLMDSITAKGATKSGETIEVAGLKLTERATIDLGLLDLLHRPYREQTINRDTIYSFKAGRPVFMLEAADGSRYVMQAYAQIIDKTLDYAALPTLGGKLKLPPGWRYLSMVPEQDLVLGAAGKATVVQDELENTYQKLD